MLSNTLFIKFSEQQIGSLLGPDHDYELSKKKFLKLAQEEIKKSIDCSMVSIQITPDEDFSVNLGKQPAPPITTNKILDIYQNILINGTWKSYNGEDLTETH